MGLGNPDEYVPSLAVAINDPRQNLHIIDAISIATVGFSTITVKRSTEIGRLGA
jgi:hypothetical protein